MRPWLFLQELILLPHKTVFPSLKPTVFVEVKVGNSQNPINATLEDFTPAIDMCHGGVITHCGTNLLIVKKIQPNLIPSEIIPISWVDLNSKLKVAICHWT